MNSITPSQKIKELHQMLKDGLISEDEFKVLKTNYISQFVKGSTQKGAEGIITKNKEKEDTQESHEQIKNESISNDDVQNVPELNPTEGQNKFPKYFITMIIVGVSVIIIVVLYSMMIKNNKSEGVSDGSNQSQEILSTIDKKDEFEIKRDPRRKDIANVFWNQEYTLFCKFSDEPIFPNSDGKFDIWYSSHEDPQPYHRVFTESELRNHTFYKFKDYENCKAWCDRKNLGNKQSTNDSGTVTSSSDDQIIKKIRELYYPVKDEEKNYTVKKGTLDVRTTEGNEIKGYFKSGTLKYIQVSYFGEMGKTIEEYYYDNNSLYFVYTRRFNYNSPLGTSEYNSNKTTVVEHRYYLWEGKLIRWIDNKGVTQPKSTYGNVESMLLDASSKYLNAFK